ncbi:tRNA synthetases class I (I, L, M and V) [Popillia japonica]|uniref:tRNA synthetases class I (I, L, M and V) n=1 Tax=Popillia japonica TaxID=7064 RepID=A0AAW1JC78_POPJA
MIVCVYDQHQSALFLAASSERQAKRCKLWLRTVLNIEILISDASKYMNSRPHFDCVPLLKSFCTKSTTDKSYSGTVLLPKTKLPLRLEGKKLVVRDRLLSNGTQFTELYQWQRKYLEGKEFILHDGPPYANGVPHMGHAINKILKDVILRSKILQGKKVHYIPGWDCHGLPIELKAISNDRALNSMAIRQKARAFASETIVKQKEAFLSWGVIGDWDKTYATYQPTYIKNQVQQFFKLFKKQLIYRDVKPVYWSPSTRYVQLSSIR